MKKRGLLVFSIIPLLLSGCVTQKYTKSDDNPTPTTSDDSDTTKQPELLTKTVEVTMVSHFCEDVGEEEFKDSCKYSDYWFLEDSSTVNYELALMSAMAGGASYSNTLDNNGAKINNLLLDIGFTNIEKNTYYSQGLKLNDSMGAIIGQKSIIDTNGKEYTLLAVFPRNAGYGAEWGGNFNLGTGEVHAGFLAARDEVLRFLKQYITTYSISGDLKIWSAGYSRGAAIANLLGGFLAEDNGYFDSSIKLASKDLFVYTIGTPNTITNNAFKSAVLSVTGPRSGNYQDTNIAAYTYTGFDGKINPTADQYKCIHNFTAIGDYITKLPAADWGFTRYGTTIDVEYGDAEMLKYLREYSPETADKFKNGKNYSTENPIKFIDIEKFDLVNTGEKISANGMIEEKIAALLNLGKNREELIESGYTELLGAITTIFDLGYKEIYNNLLPNQTAIIKTAVLNYLAYVVESNGGDDADCISKLVIELMNLLGKTVEDPETYTDQQMLEDLFDFLINDYQSDTKAVMRALKISSLVTLLTKTPYGTLYLGLLDYAKQKEFKVKTVDDLLFILSSYVTDNKDNANVIALIDLVAGLIPANYVGVLGALTGKEYKDEDYTDEKAKTSVIVMDILEACAKGLYNEEGELTSSADGYRYVLLNLGASIALSGSEKLIKLITNGTKNDYEETINEPSPISEVIEDILNLAMPKDEDGKRLTIKEVANESTAELLDKIKTEKIGEYIEILKSKPDELRQILVTLLFNSGTEFDFKSDIKNVLVLVDYITFVLPAHYHEMYISYLKSKI